MISFIHSGGEHMASYRYRVQIPAKHLSAKINRYPAETLIFAKPIPSEVALAKRAKAEGIRVITDFCDDHFELEHYQQMLDLSDDITACTPVLADKIGAQVVPDTYEFDELPSHCNGDSVLWFGHKVNYHSVCNLDIGLLRIVSNIPGCIPWSLPTLKRELSQADIVIMPATAAYKSPNRTLEAIRSGCFVVAEPHPAINDFPIYIGDLQEGIAWAKNNREQANHMIRTAQSYISQKYSPAIQVSAWRKILGLTSTSGPVRSSGQTG